MNADMMKHLGLGGYTHYKARAECFHDVISAFHIIQEYNRDKEGHHIIRLLLPNIKGYTKIYSSSVDGFNQATFIDKCKNH
jgi:hypothetical protein